MARALRVTSRNASFRQWQALLSNRKKRQRAGEFVVQGVRPITLAVRHGWPVRTLIYHADRPLSKWAAAILEDSTVAAGGAQQVAMAGKLLHELGEKAGETPELVAVAAMPADDYARIPAGPDFPRPASTQSRHAEPYPGPGRRPGRRRDTPVRGHPRRQGPVLCRLGRNRIPPGAAPSPRLVPKWYCCFVAMNLRLNDEDSALLRALAEEEGVSLHEAALRAIRRSARDLAHTSRVREATAEMLERWGDVLDRLGQA